MSPKLSPWLTELNSSISDCLLCSAISDGLYGDPPKTHNTVLFETDNIVVLPAVGPLFEGHILAVSRSHRPSFADFDADVWAEYQLLAERLREIYHDILEVEHGSSATNCGGACVVHAHIHLIPNASQHVTIFDEKYTRWEDSKNIQSINSPYLYISSGKDEQRYFVGNDFPSQAFRKKICSIEGRDDWDWRMADESYLINETIEMWST